MTLLEETVWEAYRAYGRDPQVEAGEAEGLRWVLTGAGYEGLNAILWAPVASLTDVAHALEPFRQRGVPMLWHLGPTVVEAIEKRLVAGGLEFYEEEPGMIARLGENVNPATRPADFGSRSSETCVGFGSSSRSGQGPRAEQLSHSSLACELRRASTRARRSSICSAGSTAGRSPPPQSLTELARARSSTSSRSPTSVAAGSGGP